ncbi:MAG: DNA-3-methyladenine glycosylase [Promethearchaeota archaeon]|nr:MAG: DNA-3-methyladenine glycosylase [Candidatus Lokiarchaeota archaeon]
MTSENQLKRLPRDFFKRTTEGIAKDLLGRSLVRRTKKGDMITKIIETEAYLGPNDKACHTYNYKKTKRTKTMYERPGTIYVYLIYGMYHCLNVITEPKGEPCAVLIRELYPIDGIELIKENRSVKIGKNYKNLMDGPGKLCMALDITKEKFNGKDACDPKSKLFFAEGNPANPSEIKAYKRIGIDYAEEDKDRLLRFKIEK